MENYDQLRDQSRLTTTHVQQTLPSPSKVGPNAAWTYWSNLGSVHQVPITAGWTGAVWNTKFARHFYTWPALGIELQTFWSCVQCPIHWATCSLEKNTTPKQNPPLMLLPDIKLQIELVDILHPVLYVHNPLKTPEIEYELWSYNRNANIGVREIPACMTLNPII